MRADILGGLKSAVEHGSSLEQAVQSLLNSGYNPQDVKEAADAIAGKVVSPSSSQQVAHYQAPSSAAQVPQATPSSPPQQVPISGIQAQPAYEKPKEAGQGIIIAIIILLIVVLLGLGFTIYRYLF